VDGVQTVFRSYKQAKLALQERIVYGNHIVVPYRDPEKINQEIILENALVRTLKIALETGNLDKSKEAYEHLLEKGLLTADTVDAIKEHVLYLAGLFIRLIHLQGFTVQEIAKDDYVYFHNMQSLQSKEQVIQLFYRVIDNFVIHIQKQWGSSKRQLIGEIMAYIDQEMMRDVNLQMIAHHFYINASYLSRIFKQETGKVFSAYLLERKMDKARHMLQEGIKVYDVAELLSYADVSYFIRIFHKHWGVTPGELKGKND
jgi:two-component system response regulator YesN